MNSIIELLTNPLAWKIVLTYWVFSAAVGAMPTPKQTSAGFYIWAFRFFHGLAGNLNRAAVALKVPGGAAVGSENGSRPQAPGG